MRLFGAVLVLIAAPLVAQQETPRALERAILAELVEINTSDSGGRTMDAARALARRLRDARFPAEDVRVLTPAPGQGMLIARYPGDGRAGKPILLMAHLDVVGARREDWSFDPFVFLEQDGHYYGRGTEDNKAGAAMLVANFIRYRREGYTPERDLVIVLTSDEETAGNSIQYALREDRDVASAALALNTDGGGGELKNGKPVTFAVQAAEKVYLSFQLEVRNRGGHSSLPEPDNAIYRLSSGLLQLSRHRFPVRLTEVSRAYFARSAAGQDARTAADMRALARTASPAAAARLSRVPYYNSVMRTTCVATQLFGGHAENALPQLARAIVNCRIVPSQSADSVEATLRRVLADTAIHLTRAGDPVASPPSPLTPDLMRPIEELVAGLWPGAVVIPEMSTGATDGLFTRNAGIPTYGVGALFAEIGDIRAHGRDERVGVEAYHRAAEFWYRLVKVLGLRTQDSGRR